MRVTCYTLEGKTPVPCDDVITWGRWVDSADRRVAKTDVSGVIVSTVFLGLDHQWSMDDPRPILFETMCHSEVAFMDYQERYSTWEEAEAGHWAIVALVRASLPTS